MTTIPELTKHARDLMHKAVESTKREFSGIRSNKATPSLLDTVRVEAYGSAVPINQVAMVAAPEPRLLTVQPFDKSLSNTIEKAIRDAGLGLNPATQGNLIRVPLPALSEERRKELVKVVHKLDKESRARGDWRQLAESSSGRVESPATRARRTLGSAAPLAIRIGERLRSPPRRSANCPSVCRSRGTVRIGR